VVDLSHIDLACEEDKAYEIDEWARLFKATTWEELRMIAEKNPDLSEAAESLYTMNADDLVRAKCRAREDYYRDQAVIQAKIKQLTEENAQIAAEKEQIAAEKEQIAAEKERADARAEQLAAEKTQMAAEKAQADARAEQFSSEAKFLRKLLSKNGISISEDMKKL
jgi:uncharacterized protein (DUF3084 family)